MLVMSIATTVITGHSNKQIQTLPEKTAVSSSVTAWLGIRDSTLVGPYILHETKEVKRHVNTLDNFRSMMMILYTSFTMVHRPILK